MNSVRIAIAQIDSTVGDLEGNADRIAGFAARARAAGAHLMVTPELALCGYPPEDLLLRPDFYRACARTLAELAARLPGIAVVVGHPQAHDGDFYNVASLLQDGRIAATYRKHRLPNYEVFDEQRYFSSGYEPCVIEVNGARCGINICADVWEPGAADAARQAGAELLLALNASPYHMSKQATRYEILRSRIQATGMPVLYANLVGGQDELVFDGASFALDREGRLTHQLPQFVEAMGIVDYAEGELRAGEIAPPRALEAEVYDALVLGVRDYLGKNGFPGAIIGLSGGIDSSITACIAVDAVGRENVAGFGMPGPFSSDHSVSDARAMAERLGIRFELVPIKEQYEAFLRTLDPVFGNVPRDVTEENLQARLRGVTLMAASNKWGALVLTTGNKSELAVGYCTLYGDMCGGLAVISDVPKTLVYELSRIANRRHNDAIPENVFTKPPSAELRPDQKDTDSLPPYDVLDTILRDYVEEYRAPRDIAERHGYPLELVRDIINKVDRNEYKRQQAAPGLKVTSKAFGIGRRFPIAQRFSE